MRELGVAKNPGFGMRDCGEPVLWFQIDTLGYSSLQIFGVEEAAKIIKAAKCYDIKELNGKPCVVISTDLVRGLMEQAATNEQNERWNLWVVHLESPNK